MTDKSKTEIAIVLDRSGSMELIRTDMIGGFRSFLNDQMKVPGELLLSLYQFDGLFEKVYEGVPAAEVGELRLEPRGGTALLDAVGKAITLFGERLASMSENERPGAVVFLIITDGLENQSREWTRRGVRAAIERQEKEFNWQFIYLGADPSAFEEAVSLGLSNSAKFSPNERGVHTAYAAASNSTRNYREAVNNGVVGATVELDRDSVE